MSLSPDTQPGIYGKLPGNGDFVTRRLPATFVEPWDQWLQESITVSQDQLGERWLETYLTSPVWRFALSPGTADQTPWAGLLIPSVDRVGRYFPLTLACPLSVGGNPLDIMTGAQSWYDSAEALLLACLEDDLDLATLDRQVAELGTPPVTSQTYAPLPSISGARRMALTADHATLCHSLLSQAWGELFFAYSLWWSTGSDIVEPSLLLCQGLPPTAGFSGMLAGDWGHWGWEQSRVSPIGDGPGEPRRS